MYLTAFHELSTCRQVGMAPGMIPWTAIDQWATTHGYDPEQRETLRYVVRKMDEVYLKHLESKREADRAKREAEQRAKRNKGGFNRRRGRR